MESELAQRAEQIQRIAREDAKIPVMEEYTPRHLQDRVVHYTEERAMKLKYYRHEDAEWDIWDLLGPAAHRYWIERTTILNTEELTENKGKAVKLFRKAGFIYTKKGVFVTREVANRLDAGYFLKTMSDPIDVSRSAWIAKQQEEFGGRLINRSTEPKSFINPEFDLPSNEEVMEALLGWTRPIKEQLDIFGEQLGSAHQDVIKLWDKMTGTKGWEYEMYVDGRPLGEKVYKAGPLRNTYIDRVIRGDFVPNDVKPYIRLLQGGDAIGTQIRKTQDNMADIWGSMAPIIRETMKAVVNIPTMPESYSFNVIFPNFQPSQMLPLGEYMPIGYPIGGVF